MKKECSGWNATCRQEWNLFLLERMFHNATAMWHKELHRHPCRIPLELSETALEHPSVQTLVGSGDVDLLQVAEQMYKGEYMVVPSVFTHAQCDNLMKELWRKLSVCLTQAGLQGERGPAKVSFRIWRCSWGPEEEDLALEAGQQGMQSQSGGEEPILGKGMGQGSGKAPPLYTLANFSLLALHGAIKLNCSTVPWKASSWNTGTRCGDKMLPHRKRRNLGSKSGLRWKRSWVLNQTWLQN